MASPEINMERYHHTLKKERDALARRVAELEAATNQIPLLRSLARAVLDTIPENDPMPAERALRQRAKDVLCAPALASTDTGESRDADR